MGGRSREDRGARRSESRVAQTSASQRLFVVVYVMGIERFVPGAFEFRWRELAWFVQFGLRHIVVWFEFFVVINVFEHQLWFELQQFFVGLELR